MKTLTDFALKEEYKRLEYIGDKLSEIDSLIDWKPFRIILESMYSNKTVLVLQQWHGLSDPELEKQCIDRISFRKFLGFPAYIPDSSTVWLFRKRIIKNGKEEEIWEQLQNQLDALGLKIKTWTKKGGKSHFRYKLHSIIDRDYELIRRFKTTTASIHDSQVDLSEKNEVVYRDKGYFGAKSKGYDATMKRAVRAHALGIKDILRNKRISSKRVPGERVYAVTKETFKAGKVLVTTVKRVNLKMLYTAFCYNLHQLKTLKIKGVY